MHVLHFWRSKSECSRNCRMLHQLGLHGGQINGPDPGDHLQLCSPDQKLNTFITNDPRCRDMGSGQPKCKTHPEMCLVIDNTPKLLVVSISTGILLPDLQTALLCSHLPTKCCKKSLGSGMRRDERETVSANSKQCSRMNYLEHKPAGKIYILSGNSVDFWLLLDIFWCFLVNLSRQWSTAQQQQDAWCQYIVDCEMRPPGIYHTTQCLRIKPTIMNMV